MEGIKKKIASLKEDIILRDSTIEKLNYQLDQEKERRGEVEEDNKKLRNQVDEIEEAMDNLEEKLISLSSQLEEAEKDCDEKEREYKKFENLNMMTQDKLSGRCGALQLARDEAEEADKNYEQLAKQLVLLDDDLDKAECRLSKAEAENKELKYELGVLGSNINSSDATTKRYQKKVDSAGEQISDLLKKLAASEKARDIAEKKAADLEGIRDKYEEDLDKAEEEREAAKRELEEAVNEMNDLAV